MRLPAGASFHCDYSVTEAIDSVIIWIILIIVTLGLASFVAPYYMLSSIINKTTIANGNGQHLSRLQVNFTLAEIVGHAAIWVLLAIVTLGLALFVYYYMAVKKVLNRTEIISGAALASQSAIKPPAVPTNPRKNQQTIVRR